MEARSQVPDQNGSQSSVPGDCAAAPSGSMMGGCPESFFFLLPSPGPSRAAATVGSIDRWLAPLAAHSKAELALWHLVKQAGVVVCIERSIASEALELHAGNRQAAQ